MDQEFQQQQQRLSATEPEGLILQSHPAAIDIIIPTHNGSKTIGMLLDSIQRQSFTNYECVVVDDNSRDETVRFVETEFPWVRLIRQTNNRGPAHNRNIAIAHGRSPYIAIFDDDAYPEGTEWLAKGHGILEGNPGIGQLATMIVSAYDSEILLDCGIKPMQGGGFGGTFWRRHQDQLHGKHLVPRKVLGACTAGTILRRDVFEKIGGFDEKYQYLAEDLDLSIRIHLAGLDVMYEPSLRTLHFEGGTAGQLGTAKHYLIYRNSLLVLLENYPADAAMKQLVAAVKETVVSTLRTMRRRGMPPYSWLKALREWQALVSVGFSAPRIAGKRRNTAKISQRPREYLIELGERLDEETSLHMPVRSLILLVTNKCNAQCRMCFLHDRINRKAETLAIEDLRKMFGSLGSLTNLVLGGGEPFLRKDIDQICRLALERNGQTSITVPTNGSLPDVAYDKTKSILSYGSGQVLISLSLDGLGEYHDSNRGLSGLFRTVQRCYDRLLVLRAIFGDRLSLQVNTCVTKDNLSQLDQLHGYLIANMPECQWTFEPVRGTFDPRTTEPLSREDWEGLRAKVSAFATSGSIVSGQLRPLYQHAIASMGMKTQSVPCYAGREFIFIDFEGNILPCETLFQPSINLRDIDYDLNRLAVHPDWQAARKLIRDRKCYCTHFCWLSDSISQCRTRSAFLAVPRHREDATSRFTNT